MSWCLYQLFLYNETYLLGTDNYQRTDTNIVASNQGQYVHLAESG